MVVVLSTTFNMASIEPSCAFVQVRWRIVSRPHWSWVRVASSRLLSFVLPPAPQVMLTPRGWRVARREMRAARLSKP